MPPLSSDVCQDQSPRTPHCLYLGPHAEISVLGPVLPPADSMWQNQGPELCITSTQTCMWGLRFEGPHHIPSPLHAVTELCATLDTRSSIQSHGLWSSMGT